MTDCQDVLTALLLGEADTTALVHVRTCARCRAEEAAMHALAAQLAADTGPTPPPSLAPRVLAAAAPLLARNARRAAWRTTWPAVARALAAALLPLPAILVFDVALVRAIYALLGAVLPHGLSLYLVVNHAALLVLLLSLTYGAVPVLAARQARLLLQDGHHHG
ncbi:MAG TPA: hypothetical protein VE911_11275 [Candidatus Nitrosopolaris sp.]|nr:hypothetical protein [Candidatus Nitrosopolaris sp.]